MVEGIEKPTGDDSHTKGEITETEVLQNLPEDVRKVMQIGFSMQRFGAMPSPLAEKINPEHITKMLDIIEKDGDRAYQDNSSSRNFTLVYVLIFVAFFIFLTIFLVDKDKDLYQEIIKLIFAFIGGAGSGYGIKVYLDRK